MRVEQVADLKAGAIVRWRDHPYEIVVAVETPDPPAEWPLARRVGATTLTLRPVGGQQSAVEVVRVPGDFTSAPDGDLSILSPAGRSGHHPVCGHCGGAWPCLAWVSEVAGADGIDAFTRQLQDEANRPFQCSWCSRFLNLNRRFENERGLAQHHNRGCEANPHRWDLDAQIPLFDAGLEIIDWIDDQGRRRSNDYGPDDRYEPSTARAVAQQVRQSSAAGVLPARREQLDAR